jgi:hypothetical protein
VTGGAVQGPAVSKYFLSAGFDNVTVPLDREASGTAEGPTVSPLLLVREDGGWSFVSTVWPPGIVNCFEKDNRTHDSKDCCVLSADGTPNCCCVLSADGTPNCCSVGNETVLICTYF